MLLDKIKNFTLLMILKIFIEVLYVVYVNRYFEYSGFYLDFNFYKWVASSMLLFILVIFIKNSKTYSSMYIHILLIFMFIPILSLYSLKNLESSFMLISIIGFLLIILISQYINVKTPRVVIPKQFMYVLLLIPISLLLMYFIYNGLPTFTALNLINVYDLRSENSDRNILMSYFRPWSAKVILPFFFGYFLYNKKYRLALIMFIMQFLLYLYTGHKAYIFSLLLLMFLIIILKNININRIIIGVLTSVYILTFILVIFKLDTTLASLFVRRILFIPAQNAYYYYNYFVDNEKLNLSHSIFSIILNNSYDESIPRIIGLVYYGSSAMYANTGFLGDSFMNFGFIGIIVFSIIIGIILLFIESQNKPLYIQVSAIFISMFSLINGALFTSLMTGGILLSLFILIIYQENDKT